MRVEFLPLKGKHMSQGVRYRKGDFHRIVRERVHARLAAEGRTRLAGWRGWARMVPAVAWFYGSYAILVLVPMPRAAVVAVAVSLGLAITATLCNAVHDALHQTLSSRRWLNWLVVYIASPIGESWRWWGANHIVSHHAYTDVAGLDTDLDHGGWMRLAPSQPWRRWHRFQHLYVWALYPFLALSMVVAADRQFVFAGRLKDGRKIAQPGVGRTALLLVEKLGGLTVLLGLALLAHPLTSVLAVYTIAMLAAGATLAAVLAVTHYVDTSTFPVADQHGDIPEEWAVSQVLGAATVIIRNPVISWYLGGLHHHIEHHLFPRVAHVHYPLIAAEVKAACEERGIRYTEFAGLRAVFASHQRLLRSLGRAPEPAARVALPASVAVA